MRRTAKTNAEARSLELFDLYRRREELKTELASVGGSIQRLLNEQLDESVKGSPRIMEVLEHVRRGRSNKEIGNALNITERTVKLHVSKLLSLYGARKRQELGRSF